MRESHIEKAVCDHARKLGCIVVKLGGPYGNRGIPDRMFLRGGQVCFLELKAGGKTPTALQEKWISKLRENGFFAGWADSVERGVELLDIWFR